jgi:hypothetical protein
MGKRVPSDHVVATWICVKTLLPLLSIVSRTLANAFALLFAGGPRICIGQQFALTEASYVVVRMLQKFDKIEPGKHELEGEALSNLNLTNCPARLVTCKLHEAKD